MSLSISKSGIFEAFTESPISEHSDSMCSPRRTNKFSSRRRTFYVQTSLLLLALFLPAVTSQIDGTCSCLPTSISFTFRLEPESCPGQNGGPGLGVSGNAALDQYVCQDVPVPQVSLPVELTRIDIQEFGPTGSALNINVITPDIPIPLGGQFDYDFSVGDLSEYPITSVDNLPVQFKVNLEALDADGNVLKQDWLLELKTDASSCDAAIFVEKNGLPGYTGWLEFTSIVPPLAYLCPAFGRTFEPTSLPTVTPTTSAPTDEPTVAPSNSPTDIPTLTPITSMPTDAPTTSPSISQAPTEADATASPTDVPTVSPTDEPTDAPTGEPILSPTSVPTDEPTDASTDEPIFSPTSVPTESPIDPSVDLPTSNRPTKRPVSPPTNPPTITVDDETLSPTNTPTSSPTNTPTNSPTCAKKDKKGNCKKDKKNPYGTKKDKKDKKDKKGDGSSKKDKKDKKANKKDKKDKKEPKEPKKDKKDKKEPKEPKKEKKSKKRRNLR